MLKHKGRQVILFAFVIHNYTRNKQPGLNTWAHTEGFGMWIVILEKIISQAQTAQPFIHLLMLCRDNITKKEKKSISPKHKFFICQIKGIECCPHIASLLILLIYFRDFSTKQKDLKKFVFFAQPLHNSLLFTSELSPLSQIVRSFLQKQKKMT